MASLATHPFLKTARQRVHSRPDVNAVWTWHGEWRPSRVVSIRVMQGVDDTLSKKKNAYAQALVEFDTKQVTNYPSFLSLFYVLTTDIKYDFSPPPESIIRPKIRQAAGQGRC